MVGYLGLVCRTGPGAGVHGKCQQAMRLTCFHVGHLPCSFEFDVLPQQCMMAVGDKFMVRNGRAYMQQWLGVFVCGWIVKEASSSL